jgi:uncharacterized protein YndB with AHSA1/START domain
VQALGEVLEIDPPDRVVFTWGFRDGTNGIEPGATRVAITLEEVDDGTLLTFEHDGFDAAEQAGAHRGGPSRTHEVAMFGWRMVGPEGAVLASGDNVVRLGPDGRFREVVGVRRETPDD